MSPKNFSASPLPNQNKSYRGTDVQVRSAQLQVNSLNNTASSAATLVNDGRSLAASAALVQSANKGVAFKTESTFEKIP